MSPSAPATGAQGPIGAVISLPTSAVAGEELARELGCPALRIDCHRFPDGEAKVSLPADLPERVALFASLDDPDSKLVALMLAARTARELGVRELTLVAPYLCYMRQDIAFHPGEAVSQRIVGGFLASLFDAVVTVDPHLHRIATLSEAIPARRTLALSAAPLIGRLVAQRVSDPLMLGPDGESIRWVEAAAQEGRFDFAACTKNRLGDRSVEVRLPDRDFAGRAVVLVDDVASTGRTLVEATRLLFGAGAASVDVAVTHALFVGSALDELQAAGVRHVWSTDAVAHPTNAIRLAPLLAEALR